MPDYWISIDDLPMEGRDFSFTGSNLWTDAFAEFKLPYCPGEDLACEINLLKQGKGALVRGNINGTVDMQCDRCTTKYAQTVDTKFSVYEELEDGADAHEDVDPRVRMNSGQLEINAGVLVWEQLLLALPVKPLCGNDCKGICPDCGKDLNKGECLCEKDQGDPRMSVFRNMKIS